MTAHEKANVRVQHHYFVKPCTSTTSHLSFAPVSHCSQRALLRAIALPIRGIIQAFSLASTLPNQRLITHTGVLMQAIETTKNAHAYHPSLLSSISGGDSVQAENTLIVIRDTLDALFKRNLLGPTNCALRPRWRPPVKRHVPADRVEPRVGARAAEGSVHLGLLDGRCPAPGAHRRRGLLGDAVAHAGVVGLGAQAVDVVERVPEETGAGAVSTCIQQRI